MKILIVHASAGAGHSKAAEAVFNGIKKHTSHDVRCIDVLDYTNPFYKSLYRKTYMLLISHLSFVWAFFFWLADIRLLLPIIQLGRRFFNHINGRKFEAFLQQENFDYVITTHFFSTEAVSALKGQKKITSKLICVVTDYDAHSIWLGKHVDRYAVACEYTKKKLNSLGVSDDHIAITGIPVDEKFLVAYERAALRSKLGLDPQAFTVLIATGSFGIGPIKEIVRQLKGLQCVVVCGHNQSLCATLSAQQFPHVKICGFINNMQEYMAAADVLITKPGGLSISEALAVGLPLIFFSAIPGQETNNVRVLKTFGVGVSDLTTTGIAEEIKTLNTSSAYFQAAKDRIKKIARPHSVCDIIKLIA
jgi:processive 1,2-diacylglycerol beta-glucosyltransferase